MKGLAEMFVFDGAGLLGIVLVLLTAPDGPRLRRKGGRR